MPWGPFRVKRLPSPLADSTRRSWGFAKIHGRPSNYSDGRESGLAEAHRGASESGLARPGACCLPVRVPDLANPFVT